MLVVHPEGPLVPLGTADLLGDPVIELGLVFLGHVTEPDEDQGQCGQTLLAVHDIQPAGFLVLVRHVGVQIIPGILGDKLVGGKKQALVPVIFLIELVEDVLQQSVDRIFVPFVLALVKINVIDGIREYLVDVLFIRLDVHC